MQATIIYNPLAGSANLAGVIERVALFWRQLDWQVAVQPTRAAGHAVQIAQEAAAAGQRLVIAAGGDGTLGEVANGLAGTDTVMAPLPVGTANSFARELLMPRPSLVNRQKLLVSAAKLAEGRVHAMDLGYTEDASGHGRYWMLWAGTGADGYLVDQLEPRSKLSKKLGRFGYMTQGLMVVPRLPKMRARVIVDGKLFEDEFLLVLISNCRRYAGGELLLSPNAKLDDGLFEVWMFPGGGMADAFHTFFQTRLERHHQDPAVTMVRGREIKVVTDPTMPCQTDGDRAGRSPLNCVVKPGALQLLVPTTAPPDLFDQPGTALF